MRLFIFLSICHSCWSLPRTNLYCFAGQGSDERIFKNLKVDTTTYKVVLIDLLEPAIDESLSQFARRHLQFIDHSQPYSLLGISLGGMIVTELSDTICPIQSIVISSAKSRFELPLGYQLQSCIPIYKSIPNQFIKWGAFIAQPIFEPDRDKEKDLFSEMLNSKSKYFYKRTVKMIVNWERVAYSENIIHIHGDNDHTIPIKNLNVDYIVKNGSHMMTLTRAEEINLILAKVLS